MKYYFIYQEIDDDTYEYVRSFEDLDIAHQFLLNIKKKYPEKSYILVNLLEAC